MLDSFFSTSELTSDVVTPAAALDRLTPRIDQGLSKTTVLRTTQGIYPDKDGIEDQTHSYDASELDLESRFANFGVESGDPTSRGSIYFRAEPLSDELRRAIHLLDDGRSIVRLALTSITEGNLKDSDERIMDFREYLPELFCLRTVSESFGAIVNAIRNALDNRNGIPLTQIQIESLDEALTSMMREPGMPFERSVDEIMKIEDAGFKVESVALGGFLDLVESLRHILDTHDEEKGVS